jgi:hypothetical protein
MASTGHANARLTVHGRLVLVSRVPDGRSVAHVAKELGGRGSARIAGYAGSVTRAPRAWPIDQAGRTTPRHEPRDEYD